MKNSNLQNSSALASNGDIRHSRRGTGGSLIGPGWRTVAVVGLAALVLVGSHGLSWAAVGAPAVTTAALLSQMTDLKGMSSFPDPAYTCRQFSSYDRKSESPEIEWFANADAGHYLRVEERTGARNM